LALAAQQFKVAPPQKRRDLLLFFADVDNLKKSTIPTGTRRRSCTDRAADALEQTFRNSDVIAD